MCILTDYYNLRHFALQGIGYALGLGESDRWGAIMLNEVSVAREKTNNPSLHKDDIVGIQVPIVSSLGAGRGDYSGIIHNTASCIQLTCYTREATKAQKYPGLVC